MNLDLAEAMTEKELMQSVLDCARLLGWKTYHTFDSRRSEYGFPDIVAIRRDPDRVLVAELKREGKHPTEKQLLWLSYFDAVGIPVYVWTPSSWLDDSIQRILEGE